MGQFQYGVSNAPPQKREKNETAGKSSWRTNTCTHITRDFAGIITSYMCVYILCTCAAIYDLKRSTHEAVDCDSCHNARRVTTDHRHMRLQLGLRSHFLYTLEIKTNGHEWTVEFDLE